MQRDMDLIRQILLDIESAKTFIGFLDITIEGYGDKEISYHIMLLDQAGYIVANDTGSGGWRAVSLTWDGHEFLDTARDDTQWNKAKTMIKEKVGSTAFEIIKQVLYEMAKQAMGLKV